jgi:serine/threonine-protein kinase
LNDSRRKIVDEIFAAALELNDSERAQFVHRKCDGDDLLEREVLALLNASSGAAESFDRQIDSIRDSLWSDLVDENDSAEEDLSGERIAAWRIDERIARGGLATVYIAHREEGTFEQTVAFK